MSLRRDDDELRFGVLVRCVDNPAKQGRFMDWSQMPGWVRISIDCGPPIETRPDDWEIVR